MTTGSTPEAKRTATINLRLHESARDLIDQAAAATGRTRTDFMVEAARREAEAVLLDRRLFLVGEKEFEAFKTALDQSPATNPRLRRLLRTAAPWD